MVNLFVTSLLSIIIFYFAIVPQYIGVSFYATFTKNYYTKSEQFCADQLGNLTQLDYEVELSIMRFSHFNGKQTRFL